MVFRADSVYVWLLNLDIAGRLHKPFLGDG